MPYDCSTPAYEEAVRRVKARYSFNHQLDDHEIAREEVVMLRQWCNQAIEAIRDHKTTLEGIGESHAADKRLWEVLDDLLCAEVPDKIRSILDNMLTKKGIDQWWRGRNRMLEGLRPCDVWHDRIEDVVRAAKQFGEDLDHYV